MSTTITNNTLKQIDLLTLRLFVSISESGSLTAAAKQGHLALAAVSRRISELEEYLGVSLLYRRSRGAELTPAGLVLLRHATRILNSIEHMHADVSEYAVGSRGHVRVFANTSAIIEFLPVDLSSFLKSRPQIHINLKERMSREVLHAVRSGQADVGIYAAHISIDGLKSISYRSDQLVLVTPMGHPLVANRKVALCDALEFGFVGLQQDTSLYGLLRDAAQLVGKPIRMNIQVRSFEGVCQMIAHGLGIGVLPYGAVSAHIHELNLCIVRLCDEWANRELRIAYKDLQNLSVPARDLINHLSQASNADPGLLE